jgi:hypothetical protein
MATQPVKPTDNKLLVAGEGSEGSGGDRGPGDRGGPHLPGLDVDGPKTGRIGRISARRQIRIGE